jgi:hypothetical protein
MLSKRRFLKFLVMRRDCVTGRENRLRSRAARQNQEVFGVVVSVIHRPRLVEGSIALRIAEMVRWGSLDTITRGDQDFP